MTKRVHVRSQLKNRLERWAKFSATEAERTTLFAAHGTVESANVIADKFTGRSRQLFKDLSMARHRKKAPKEDD